MGEAFTPFPSPLFRQAFRQHEEKVKVNASSWLVGPPFFPPFYLRGLEAKSKPPRFSPPLPVESEGAK